MFKFLRKGSRNEDSGDAHDESTEVAAGHTPRLFVKPGCPFCTRLVIFLDSAKLQDTVEYEFDTEENRAYILKCITPAPTEFDPQTGQPRPVEPSHKVTFPCLELIPGEIKFETDELISYFAEQHGVDMDNGVFGFRYYRDGVGDRYAKLQRRLGFGLKIVR